MFTRVEGDKLVNKHLGAKKNRKINECPTHALCVYGEFDYNWLERNKITEEND